MVNFHKKILKNGLRIITVPMKDNPTVTVLVLVEAGSKYETKKQNGISHFLEHMCFKGTEKRPTAYDISHELDGLGSQSNAFTSQEYTGYYAKSAATHFKKIFDVVSDIYLNPALPREEIEKEKGVIIEEINMYEDMPQHHVEDLFTSLLYGDQPAGWQIGGTKENVRNFRREDFAAYHQAHYVPKKTVVVVSGNISEKEVWKEIEKTFGRSAGGKKIGKLPVHESQVRPAMVLKYKKSDQAHLVLGVRTFDMYDKRTRAVGTLAGILSGGSSSRLFQKLREEMGVCYYVRAHNDTCTDHGALEIAVGCDVKRVDEVIKVILAECRKLVNELVQKEELERVKEYLIGNLNLELESSDAFATFYGGQEILHKKIKKPGEIEKEVRKMTSHDIQKIAKEIFINKNLNLALIGPFHKSGPFLKSLKF